MKGEPAWFNTKQDVENWRTLAGDEAYKAIIQKFYDARMEWETTSTLEEGQLGVEDDTHRVIESIDMETQEPVRYQQELQANPDAYIFSKLGFTEEEILGILAE